MKTSNVISLDSHRESVQVHRRMEQNSLTLTTAIGDSRLNRYDLEMLAKLLDLSVISGLIRHRYQPENQCVIRSLGKLQKAGYLTEPTIRDLVAVFRRNGDCTPERFWIFELTERELNRLQPWL